MGHPAGFCPGNSDLVCACGLECLRAESSGGKLPKSLGSEGLGGLQQTCGSACQASSCAGTGKNKTKKIEKAPEMEL